MDYPQVVSEPLAVDLPKFHPSDVTKPYMPIWQEICIGTVNLLPDYRTQEDFNHISSNESATVASDYYTDIIPKVVETYVSDDEIDDPAHVHANRDPDECGSVTSELSPSEVSFKSPRITNAGQNGRAGKEKKSESRKTPSDSGFQSQSSRQRFSKHKVHYLERVEDIEGTDPKDSSPSSSLELGEEGENDGSRGRKRTVFGYKVHLQLSNKSMMEVEVVRPGTKCRQVLNNVVKKKMSIDELEEGCSIQVECRKIRTGDKIPFTEPITEDIVVLCNVD